MTTWLGDPTANKYIKTYFKDFVDISGDLLVRNSSYLDISQNVQLKGSTMLVFPDGTSMSTAAIPSNFSTQNLITGNLTTGNLVVNKQTDLLGNTTVYGFLKSTGDFILSDNTIQTTAFTPANCNITNLSVSGSITLPTNSINNNALQANVVITDKIQTLSNKTINSVGITDTGTAIFNDVVISGTFTLPQTISVNQLNAGNVSISGQLDTSGCRVNNLLDASACVIQNNLTVKGTSYLNALEWNATSIKVNTTSGILIGRMISLTQLAYSTSISTPLVGDYISTAQPYAPGIENRGPNGPAVLSVNTTTRIVTMSSNMAEVMPTPEANKQVYGYALSTTQIQTNGILNVQVNDVCTPTPNPNRPYVSSTSVANKTITLAGASLVSTPSGNATGVYDSLNRLISNNMPPLGTLFGSGATVSQISSLITPKYATISATTPNPPTTGSSITGYVSSTTQITTIVNPSGYSVGDFLRDSDTITDFTKGCTISSINGTLFRITFTNGTLTKGQLSGTTTGFCPSANLMVTQLNGGAFLAVNNFAEIVGQTLTRNRISAYTAGQYRLTLDPSCNAVQSAHTDFNGYIDQTRNMVVQNGSSLVSTRFLYGTGLSTTGGNYRVDALVSTNTYDISYAGTAPVVATRNTLVGIAHNATTFLYSTATSPVVGDFIGHQVGSRVSAVNTTTQALTTTNLTPTPLAGTRLGTITSTNTIQLEPSANMSGIVAGQFIKATGIPISTPYISSVNTGAKTITMFASNLSPTASVDISGCAIQSVINSLYYLATTSPISTATYFTGTGISSQSRTVGDGSTTLLTNQYTSLSTPTAVSPYRTGLILFSPANGIKVYKAIAGSLLTNNSFLQTERAGDTIGARVSSTGGTTNDCQLIMSNGSTITAQTPTQIYGRIVKYAGGAYLYYKYAPAIGNYLYNSNVADYNNGGFVEDTAVGGYSRCNVSYKQAALTTNTPIDITVPGYIASSGKVFIRADNFDKLVINGGGGVGKIVEIMDGTSNNQLKNAWISTLLPTGGTDYGVAELITLNTSNADPAYVKTTLKNYTVLSANKNLIYCVKVSPSDPVPAVDDFVDFGAASPYTTGAYVSDVSSVLFNGVTTYIITLDGKAWTYTPVLNDPIKFATPVSMNIYENNPLDSYTPITNVRAYNMGNYTTKAETVFSFYNPVSDFKYNGAAYEMYTPQTVSLYISQSYTISAAQTIPYFTPTLFQFYLGTPITNFIDQRTITIPQSIDVSGDTFCLLKLTQTLLNKTLTSPNINTPNIDGSLFKYVPWTEIVNHTGISGSFTDVVTAPTTAPTPSSHASTRFVYKYSVVGNSLYMNWYYYTPSFGTNGSGIYYYKLPTGYNTTGALSPSLVPYTTNLSTGTQIGCGKVHISGVAVSYNCRCFYDILSSVPYIVMEIDNNLHSSTLYQYGYTNVGYSFQVEIPLA